MQVYSAAMARKTPDPATELLGCTCKHLRMATRRLSMIYDRHLEPVGVTINQYSLLANLMAHDGIGLGAFAEKLVMDPTTLTRNLRPLQRQRLVVLAPDPNDKRSRVLHLTDRGRAAFAKARPAWARAQSQIESAFGRGDTAALHTTLQRLLERLPA
jgi:DNA-binding MarR family transcriptional regulator